MFDLLLFDLDGTLVDSSYDLTDGLNYALSQLGFPTYTREQVIKLVGHGVRETVFRGLPEDKREMLEEAYPLFLDWYAEHCTDNTFLYPGMEQVLEAFSHLPMVLTTNKRSLMSERVLRENGVDKYFKAVLGPDRVENKKPHPDHLLTACDIVGIPAARTVLFGDSAVDIQAAKAAGIPVCAVTYGFTPRSLLEAAAPDYLVDAPLEIIGLLSRHSST